MSRTPLNKASIFRTTSPFHLDLATPNKANRGGRVRRGNFTPNPSLCVTVSCHTAFKSILFLLLVIATQGIWAQPVPLLGAGNPVDWWFAFKLNTKAFPGCAGDAQQACIFGGTAQRSNKYSQQFVYASKNHPTLTKGATCLGDDSLVDPLGASFEQVYAGSYNYVIWNDQFYGDPKIKGCSASCGSPWGHSKGMVSWDEQGNGFVLQVSTPSWPASGSKDHPRLSDGNTLGCVTDNDILVSQHFFALKLTKSDLVSVLKALQNASIVTDPSNPQIVRNGGPADVQALVSELGSKSPATTATAEILSSGVTLISKPSKLHVPPWQMVSALLGSVPLRTATWWAHPAIPSTTASTTVGCWDSSLKTPGAVEIATSGQWDGVEFGLKGNPSANGNHAKIGVSDDNKHSYVVFGDMNQQGSLSGPNCGSSQNGRGGLFYVVQDTALHRSVKALIAGSTAPTWE